MTSTALRRIALLSLIGASGCGLNEFDVTQEAQATITGGSLLGQVLNTFPPMQGFNSFDFSQSQDFKNENAHKDQVRSARLKSFTLQITSPGDQDFSFLDSIEFSAEADGTTSWVARELDIGSLGLKAPTPTLVLDLNDVELEKMVKADRMSITTKASGRQPPKDTTLTARVVFHLVVGL
jgi:hypothetical protein